MVASVAEVEWRGERFPRTWAEGRSPLVSSDEPVAIRPINGGDRATDRVRSTRLRTMGRAFVKGLSEAFDELPSHSWF